MPSKIVLPVVLEELNRSGIEDSDITVVFALGNHRAHTEDEKKYLAGDEAYSRVRCVDSDQSRIKRLGLTSLGTPVDVFEEVADADRVVCLGNIEYHYFAGYSGGAKAIIPGVSTAAAIQANHSRMVEEASAAGRLNGNRLRADIDEIARFLKIDFIVNVVLNEKKEIIKAVAGDYIKAHREGCAFLDTLYKVPIKEKADIVIVSPGGYPKDINLYQAQKAMDNSKYAVRDGGVIILVAECKEGLGEEVFERWMKEAKSPADMVEKIQAKFELGGHKAAAIGMVQMKADVYLVSGMDDDFVKSMFFTPFKSVQDALDSALGKLGKDAGVILMPYGGSTLPGVCKKWMRQIIFEMSNYDMI
jgi:nickel-dependent lactate racemase